MNIRGWNTINLRRRSPGPRTRLSHDHIINPLAAFLMPQDLCINAIDTAGYQTPTQKHPNLGSLIAKTLHALDTNTISRYGLALLSFRARSFGMEFKMLVIFENHVRYLAHVSDVHECIWLHR